MADTVLWEAVWCKKEMFGASPDFTIIVVPLSVQGTSVTLPEPQRVFGKVKEKTQVKHNLAPGAGQALSTHSPPQLPRPPRPSPHPQPPRVPLPPVTVPVCKGPALSPAVRLSGDGRCAVCWWDRHLLWTPGVT